MPLYKFFQRRELKKSFPTTETRAVEEWKNTVDLHINRGKNPKQIETICM
jgi:hypothetical protein